MVVVVTSVSASAGGSEWMVPLVPDPKTASRATARAQHVASQDFTLRGQVEVPGLCNTYSWPADCHDTWTATAQGDWV